MSSDPQPQNLFFTLEFDFVSECLIPQISQPKYLIDKKSVDFIAVPMNEFFRYFDKPHHVSKTREGLQAYIKELFPDIEFQFKLRIVKETFFLDVYSESFDKCRDDLLDFLKEAKPVIKESWCDIDLNCSMFLGFGEGIPFLEGREIDFIDLHTDLKYILIYKVLKYHKFTMWYEKRDDHTMKFRDITRYASSFSF